MCMGKYDVTVVRVSKTEFELSDGRVIPHIVELDEVPTPEEFQTIYDCWKEILLAEIGLDESKRETAKCC